MLNSMEKRRREWIDETRKQDPTFAPDIESSKELLSEEELAEVGEYEELRYKYVARQGREQGYRPYKLTVKQKKRLRELHDKYQHIYYKVVISGDLLYK